jgi:ClpP class serine protease
MKRYISTLRTETNKLREVLASKDQLLADKSGLNKEVVAQNRQIAALTHDNAQLKLLVEGAQAKEATLLDTIRRLEIKVEEERQEAVKLKQSFSDSRLFSPVSATANYPEG